MLFRPPYLLAAVFLVVAVVFAVYGAVVFSSGFFGVGLGLALHAMGAERGLAPLMWFGAAIAAFAVVVMAWAALSPAS